MSNGFLLIPIFFPVICGALFFALNPKTKKARNTFVLTSVLLNTAIMFVTIFLTNDILFTLFDFSGDLTIALNLDGLGKIFAGLVSVLWPFTALYALEYMKKEEHIRMFYTFFLVSYGVTLGIACSGNMLTMYFFYELLTLVTLPLVIQPMTKASNRAGRAYLIYSIGGAAFAFIGLIFILSYGSGAGFTMGGVLTNLGKFSQEFASSRICFSFYGLWRKSSSVPAPWLAA